MNAWVKYKGLLYLAGLVVVLPWLSYRVAIADNVRLSRETTRFEKETASLRDRCRRSGPSAAIMSDAENILQSGSLIPAMMACEAGGRCKVVKYTPYVTEKRDGLTAHTAELEIKGSYADLLRLIAAAEQGLDECKLVSASFRSIRNRQKKETQLHMTLIFQQITQNAK